MHSLENVHDSVVEETRVLNNLIVSTIDNIDEYRRAVFVIEQQLNLLRRRIFDRTHAVERLQREVRALGGQPANTRSPLAAAFAALLSVRQRFLRDDENLVQDAERGDQLLRRQFESLLNTRRLSQSAHESVAEAYDCIVPERREQRPSDTQEPIWQDDIWTNSPPAMVASPLSPTSLASC